MDSVRGYHLQLRVMSLNPIAIVMGVEFNFQGLPLPSVILYICMGLMRCWAKLPNHKCPQTISTH